MNGGNNYNIYLIGYIAVVLDVPWITLYQTNPEIKY